MNKELIFVRHVKMYMALLGMVVFALVGASPSPAAAAQSGESLSTSDLQLAAMTVVSVERGEYEVVHPRTGELITRPGIRTVLVPTVEQAREANLASSSLAACSVIHTTFDPEVSFVPPGDYYAEGLLEIDNGCSGSASADHYLSMYESPGGWVVKDHNNAWAPAFSTRTSLVSQLCYNLSSESWLNSSSGGAGDQANLGCTA